MAFMDSILEFWDGQVLTAQEESRTNGNILDMESDGVTAAFSTDQQLGFIYWNLLVGVAAGGMASGGYFQLVTSDSATFASGVECIASFGSAENPLAAADLPADARFSAQVPLRAMKRYVEVEWIDVSEDASGLEVDSWMGMEPLQELNTQKEPT